ncbi:MAG: hypothetical protein K2X98_05335 [Alphaproteobacteria bacterium]|nr:hypothetical protein [Alphaproteobacteria bacterium]
MGIAPVVNHTYPLSDMTFVHARTAAIFGDRFDAKPAKKSWLLRLSESKRLNQFIDHWVVQEFRFVMNKLSILGLVTGLMFLGAIFFAVGFLTAYRTLPASDAAPGHAQVWANALQSGGKGQGENSGTAGNPLASIGANTLGSQVQQGVSSKLDKVLGGLGALASKIPAPLQPFIHFADNRVSQKITQSAHAASDYSRDQAKRVFSGQAPQMPQYTPQNHHPQQQKYPPQPYAQGQQGQSYPQQQQMQQPYPQQMYVPQQQTEYHYPQQQTQQNYQQQWQQQYYQAPRR